MIFPPLHSFVSIYFIAAVFFYFCPLLFIHIYTVWRTIIPSEGNEKRIKEKRSRSTPTSSVRHITETKMAQARPPHATAITGCK